ncbi:MAG TPA: restriction endonuclease subunit S, partial [Bacteroidetes bacterium]|nr:restriction endonuclease subunit S [Bacteroidota bacterium]
NFIIENEYVPYVNMAVDLSKISKEDFCKIGDIVMADASEDYMDIGKAIEIRSLGNENLISGLHTHLLRYKNKCAIGFFGYLFQYRKIRLQIMKMATGVSVLGISKTNLSKIIMKIPCIEEQKRIATFLTALDEKINKVGEQAEQMREWKKGLLQQMFV